MATQFKDRFDVGGFQLERPFKIRRLGHFGFYATEMQRSMHFYNELLGFQITDQLDFAARAKDPKQLEGLGDSRAYFMRYGTDHHAFVLFPWRVRRALDTENRIRDGATMNQITWQVGSLQEVRHATDWFTANGIEYNRTGRDLPGSNWHVYPFDPDGRVNELYYGIEQIGWDGLSKPRDMYEQRFMGPPEIPYMREAEEIRLAREAGIDLSAGTRSLETGEAKYDVGGIMLTRPFKITGIGPVRLFTDDMAAALDFYCGRLGFTVTETVDWKGQDCAFLLCGAETAIPPDIGHESKPRQSTVESSATPSKRTRKPKAAAAQLNPSQKAATANTPLRIPYGNKDVAQKLGARYAEGGWYAPPGVDLSNFSAKGWL